jgi:hypothetical protein
MKHLLVAMFVGLTSALAQFEGVVESKNLTTDEVGTAIHYPMTMWVKGEMVKIAIPAYGENPGTTMIYRRDRRVMWTLVDAEKSYFEILLNADRELGAEEPVRKEPRPALKKTGKSKSILGYPCDQFLVKAGDVETEFWGTKKLGSLAATIQRVFAGSNGDGGRSWDDEIAKMGYFPVVARTRLEGRVVESSEVTRVEQRKLPADLFDVPPGYKKQGVKDMLNTPPPKN